MPWGKKLGQFGSRPWGDYLDFLCKTAIIFLLSKPHKLRSTNPLTTLTSARATLKHCHELSNTHQRLFIKFSWCLCIILSIAWRCKTYFIELKISKCSFFKMNVLLFRSQSYLFHKQFKHSSTTLLNKPPPALSKQIGLAEKVRWSGAGLDGVRPGWKNSFEI